MEKYNYQPLNSPSEAKVKSSSCSMKVALKKYAVDEVKVVEIPPEVNADGS